MARKRGFESKGERQKKKKHPFVAAKSTQCICIMCSYLLCLISYYPTFSLDVGPDDPVNFESIKVDSPS